MATPNPCCCAGRHYQCEDHCHCPARSVISPVNSPQLQSSQFRHHNKHQLQPVASTKHKHSPPVQVSGLRSQVATDFRARPEVRRVILLLKDRAVIFVSKTPPKSPYIVLSRSHNYILGLWTGGRRYRVPPEVNNNRQDIQSRRPDKTISNVQTFNCSDSSGHGVDQLFVDLPILTTTEIFKILLSVWVSFYCQPCPIQ